MQESLPHERSAPETISSCVLELPQIQVRLQAWPRTDRMQIHPRYAEESLETLLQKSCRKTWELRSVVSIERCYSCKLQQLAVMAALLSSTPGSVVQVQQRTSRVQSRTVVRCSAEPTDRRKALQLLSSIPLLIAAPAFAQRTERDISDDRSARSKSTAMPQTYLCKRQHPT